MFGLERYKKLQAQVEKLQRDISSANDDNRRLEQRVGNLEIKDFDNRYPNGKIRQRTDSVWGNIEIAIDLVYVSGVQIKTKRISEVKKKLEAFKLKQTEKSIYIGLKFAGKEEFYVLNKAADMCIKLEESGLQDVEWVEAHL